MARRYRGRQCKLTQNLHAARSIRTNVQLHQPSVRRSIVEAKGRKGLVTLLPRHFPITAMTAKLRYIHDRPVASRHNNRPALAVDRRLAFSAVVRSAVNLVPDLAALLRSKLNRDLRSARSHRKRTRP